MQEGNPQLILKRGEQVQLPPMLIIQGDKDDNIPREIPERFEEAYRAAGGAIELEWFPGMPHAFINSTPSGAARAITIVKAFIARQIGAWSGAP